MHTNQLADAAAPTSTTKQRHGRAPRARSLRRTRQLWTVAALALTMALGSLGTFTNAAAQSVNLDIERGGHPMTVSTENGGAYLKHDVKASGSTRFFCNDRGVTTCNVDGRQASVDAHTMNYAVEITWEKPLREVSEGQVVGSGTADAKTGSDGGLERRVVGVTCPQRPVQVEC